LVSVLPGLFFFINKYKRASYLDFDIYNICLKSIRNSQIRECKETSLIEKNKRGKKIEKRVKGGQKRYRGKI
jgi:hypothetical protein